MPAGRDIHANVPPALKRQVFSLMALQGIRFSEWVRDQMERFVAEATVREGSLPPDAGAACLPEEKRDGRAAMHAPH